MERSIRSEYIKAWYKRFSIFTIGKLTNVPRDVPWFQSSLPCCSVVALLCLLLGHPIIDCHDEGRILRLDKDGDGVEPGGLESLDGVATDV